MSSMTTLARPYARAAFEVAQAAGQLQAWSNALQVSGALSAAPEMQNALQNPAVDSAARKALVAVDDAPEGYDAFLSILSENRRMSVLAEIHAQFQQLKAASEAVINVNITSAVDLNADYREKLQASLTKRLNANVDVSYDTDSSLLGGAIIRAGDDVIDGSVRGKLAAMAKAII